MISDPVEAAALTTRDVRNGSRGGAPTKIVVARRTYGTNRRDLWSALTDPERLPRWFLPISGDLQIGGRYQFAGNAGGVVVACKEPTSFTVTWEMGPIVSWLTVNLAEVRPGEGKVDDADSSEGERTELELVHEAPIDPGMWSEYGPGAVGVGWDLAMLGLGLHLDSGEAVDPAVGLGFPLTPDGRHFVERASGDWASAAIRAGDEPEAARAAAERTTAFYTVDPSTTS